MRVIDDELLGAYLDDELAPEVRAEVLARVASDPTAALRLARMRAADDLIRSFPEYEEAAAGDPIREQILSSAPANTRLAAARRPAFPRTAALMGGGLAACLAVGLALGAQIPSATPLRISPDSGLIASGDLARALDTVVADAGGDDFRVRVSFRRADGTLCRQFRTTSVEGVGCRTGDAWRMVVVTPAAGAQGGYTAAAADGSPLVEAAIDAMGDVTPLDADEERAAARAGWRRDRAR